MSKAGCVSWDDEELNLDLLLGDYTDYDELCDTECAQEDTQSVMYECPECQNLMKSISGFRGHVYMEHNLNLKANEHKKTTSTNQATGRERTKSRKTSEQQPQPFINKETYDRIFNESFKHTLLDISQNPMYNIFGKSRMSENSEYIYSESNEYFRESIKAVFGDLVDFPCNIVSSEDRIMLYTRLHRLRLSEQIQDLVENMKQKGIPHPDEMNNFIQAFLLDMTQCLLENMTKLLKGECNSDYANISDNEQKVLFYTSGYIIHALNKKYSRPGKLNKLKRNIVLGFTAKKSSETSKKYATILENKNKGALKLPNDYLFLMVRSMERVVIKKDVLKSLSQQSLDKNILIETLMEDFMVKFYMEELSITNETKDEDSEHVVVTGLLEDICHLFVTIRKFTMAKLQRNKLQ